MLERLEQTEGDTRGIYAKTKWGTDVTGGKQSGTGIIDETQ